MQGFLKIKSTKSIAKKHVKTCYCSMLICSLCNDVRVPHICWDACYTTDSSPSDIIVNYIFSLSFYFHDIQCKNVAANNEEQRIKEI